MHLIDAAGHVNNQFVHEDPANNRPPTEVDADWLNAVQNEIANAISGMGLELNKADQSQLLKAIQKAVPVNATTEKAGVLKLATLDQAKAGVLAGLAVSPEGLAAAIGLLSAVLPVGADFVDTTALRALNTTYTNLKPYEVEIAYTVASIAPGTFQVEVLVGGERLTISTSYGTSANTGDGLTFPVPAGKTWRLQNPSNCTLVKVREKVKG